MAHRPLALAASFGILVACGREAPPPSPAPATGAATAPTEPASGETGDVAVGKPAPEVAAKAHDGEDIKLSTLKGKHVVLYFYPKDETPGCTKEACSFRDAWTELSKAGTVLVGVSTDSLESHRKFAEHHKLPFHLVSDESGTIAKAYGVPSNNGYLARQTFVIGPDGSVKKIYRSVDVSKHAAEILADVKGS